MRCSKDPQPVHFTNGETRYREKEAWPASLASRSVPLQPFLTDSTESLRCYKGLLSSSKENLVKPFRAQDGAIDLDNPLFFFFAKKNRIIRLIPTDPVER